MNKRTVLVLQARMTSTRLPGKVLLPVLGKPLLEIQIERLRRAQSVDEIVVATTDKPSDDAIVNLCAKLAVPIFRGSEDDVLGRFYGAASAHRAHVVVRCTADCPLIDWGLVDNVVTAVSAPQSDVDYASNSLGRTYPIGLDCEAFTFAALEEAHHEAQDPREREHVTPFLYTHPERFRIQRIVSDKPLSHHRWTVDTSADFALIEHIITGLSPTNPAFRWTDVLAFVEARPGLAELNAHVPHRSWNHP